MVDDEVNQEEGRSWCWRRWRRPLLGGWVVVECPLPSIQASSASVLLCARTNEYNTAPSRGHGRTCGWHCDSDSCVGVSESLWKPNERLFRARNAKLLFEFFGCSGPIWAISTVSAFPCTHAYPQRSRRGGANAPSDASARRAPSYLQDLRDVPPGPPGPPPPRLPSSRRPVSRVRAAWVQEGSEQGSQAEGEGR